MKKKMLFRFLRPRNFYQRTKEMNRYFTLHSDEANSAQIKSAVNA